MSLGRPGGPDLDLTAMGWSNWVGLMVTTHFDLVSRLLLQPRAHCPLPISHCPLRPRAPLWAKTFFCRNIGMWGVQSVAMKRPAHRELFQPIWKHPAGENRQKHKFWVLGGGRFAVCLCHVRQSFCHLMIFQGHIKHAKFSQVLITSQNEKLIL